MRTTRLGIQRTVRFALPLLLAALCGPLLATPARAHWPSSPGIGGVPVSTAAGNQQSPSGCTDGAGGMIVAWNDSRGSFPYDIFVQRVDAKGQPRWTAQGVPICEAVFSQNLPAVCSDGAGGAIIAWYDARSSGGGSEDIYVQRVNASGVPLWTPGGVLICGAIGSQTNPQIIADAAGGAIVCWQDLRTGSSDIYAQRVNASGAAQWLLNGVGVCTATGYQIDARMTTDAAGGAIVTWNDLRDISGVAAVYARRITPSGSLLWAVDGTLVSTAPFDQGDPAIVDDGAGGALIAMTDLRNGVNLDISIQRLDAAGNRLFTNDGVLVCSFANTQFKAGLASDGNGGAIVAWNDSRPAPGCYAEHVQSNGTPLWGGTGTLVFTYLSTAAEVPSLLADGAGGAIIALAAARLTAGQYDVYAQHLSATGAPLWGGTPVAITSAYESQQRCVIVSDGAGGAIAAWDDIRSVSTYDLYAQHVDAFGALGREPDITRVRDLPNDQGGRVSVQWNASVADIAPGNPITGYAIWRQLPTTLAQARIARGARVRPGAASVGAPDDGSLLATVTAAQTFYWEYVAQVAASGFAAYSYAAATASDSVAGSNPYTKFMVTALEAGGVYHASAADSGYSVDNLPPSPPSPFAATYAGGVASLHWAASGAPDLAGYRLYRGTSAGFVPSQANLVAAVPDTGYADAAGSPYYYKLSAVDSHGNESTYLLAQPAGTLAVGDPDSHALALRGAWPNPSSGEARIAFALPRSARVTLAVHDASGRLVRRLVDGDVAAGERSVAWDGRDGRGRTVPGGLYFVRLEAGGERRVTRLARIE